MSTANAPPEPDPPAPIETAELVAVLENHAQSCEDHARHYRARATHDPRYPENYEQNQAAAAEDDARIDRAMASALRERDVAVATVRAWEADSLRALDHLNPNDPDHDGPTARCEAVRDLALDVREKLRALRTGG